ncbi:MAG: T9SS type A sorting domain-containing protein [Flavobacteriaceae bacterium]
MKKITQFITLIIFATLSWHGYSQSAPDCPTLDSPANGAIDHPHTVVLNWTAAITGDAATSYDIYWGTTSGALTNIGNLTGTSATITNINFGATYFWSIHPVNATGTTDCSATEYSFTIKDAPTAPTGVTCTTGGPGVVYSEEMEAQGAWTGDFGTANGTWKFGTAGTPSPDTGPSGPSSGAGYLFYEASGDVTDVATIVSPNFDLTSMGSEQAELTFNLHAYGNGIGVLNVGVATTAAGPFTQVFTWSGSAQNASGDAYLPVGADVTSYLGGPLYVQFEHTGAGNWHGDLAIDLVQIQSCTATPPACDSVLTATTSVSGDISWGAPSGGATGYKLQVGTTTGGSEVLAQTDIGSGSTYNVGALSENTMYYVTITPYNGNGDATGCTEQTFTTGTLPDCVASLDEPADMAVDYKKNITLRFTPATTGEVATSYDVYLGDSATTLALIGNTTNDAVNLLNMNFDQTYFWSVNPVNGTGTSDCSATINSFTVQSAPDAPSCNGNVTTLFTEEMDLQGFWTGDFAAGNGTWNFDGDATPSGGATFLTGPTAPFSGNAYMFYEASGDVTDTASAVSPSFDLSNVTAAAAELTFNLHAYGVATGTLVVGASTTAAGPFTPIYTWDGSAHDGQAEAFTAVGVDLTAYIGGDLYIEFSHTGAGGWQGDLAIDLVEIKTCDANAAGIDNNLTIEGLEIYPNPVSKVLSINAENNIDRISIFNMLGQEVINSRPHIYNTEINMSNLSAGMYVVRVQIGTKTGTYRIIKK